MGHNGSETRPRWCAGPARPGPDLPRPRLAAQGRAEAEAEAELESAEMLSMVLVIHMEKQQPKHQGDSLSCIASLVNMGSELGGLGSVRACCTVSPQRLLPYRWAGSTRDCCVNKLCTRELGLEQGLEQGLD